MTIIRAVMDFFDASKLFWIFAAPSHVLVWMLAAGVIFHRFAFGRALAASAALGFLAILLLPVGDWALNSLENQYPRGSWPAHVDGVLELGGGINPGILAARGLPGAETGEDRMVAVAELAQRYPHARIVFSGGNPDRGVSEADVARYILGQLGQARGILFESHARDTWENFVFARALARPEPGEAWLLVTSAAHMPRAMAVARGVNWTMQPWPSGYATMPGGGPQSFGDNIMHLDLAAHEWVGLAAYRLAGRAR